jgi:hypothetical protein
MGAVGVWGLHERYLSDPFVAVRLPGLADRRMAHLRLDPPEVGTLAQEPGGEGQPGLARSGPHTPPRKCVWSTLRPVGVGSTSWRCSGVLAFTGPLAPSPTCAHEARPEASGSCSVLGRAHERSRCASSSPLRAFPKLVSWPGFGGASRWPAALRRARRPCDVLRLKRRKGSATTRPASSRSARGR